METDYVNKIKAHQGRFISPVFHLVLDKLGIISATFGFVTIIFAAREIWLRSFDREDLLFGLMSAPFILILCYFIAASKPPQ